MKKRFTKYPSNYVQASRNWREKTECKTKNGKIIHMQNVSNNFNDVDYYILYDADGNFVEKSLDFNDLHDKLYGIKASTDDYIGRGRYAPTMEDDTIYKDLPWIAEEIAKQLNYWTEVFGHDCYTVESAIEAFVMMNDDYDDWWARGCSSPEAEDRFIQALIEAMRSQGIELVDDRRNDIK